MRLATLMKSKIFSVSPSDSLDKAICLMDEHYIHHLPVLENGRLVGMVSDRDLLIAVGWKLECERRPTTESEVAGPRQIRDIMTQSVVRLSPENDVHTAARMMAAGKFHAMPIVYGSTLIGIVTSTDILETFYERQNFASISPTLQEPISKYMRTRIFAVAPSDFLNSAVKIMRDANIRHLPVTLKGELVGIISDHDLRKACGAEMIEDEKAEVRGSFYIGPTEVRDVMVRQIYTMNEDTPVINAIQAMIEHRIGCLPVMRDNSLVGIVTDTDILRIIAEIDDND